MDISLIQNVELVLQEHVEDIYFFMINVRDVSYVQLHVKVLQKLLASVTPGKAVLLITADPSFVTTLIDAQMRACRVWLLTDGSVAASSLQSTADWALPWTTFLSSCRGINFIQKPGMAHVTQKPSSATADPVLMYLSPAAVHLPTLART